MKHKDRRRLGKSRTIKFKRGGMSALSILITFIVVYSLMNPAMAIGQQEAAREAGIVIEGEENEPEPDLSGKEVNAAVTAEEAAETAAGAADKEATAGAADKEATAGATEKETAADAANRETAAGVTDKETAADAANKETAAGVAADTGAEEGTAAEAKTASRASKSAGRSAGGGNADRADAAFGMRAEKVAGETDENAVFLEGSDQPSGISVRLWLDKSAGLPAGSSLEVHLIPEKVKTGSAGKVRENPNYRTLYHTTEQLLAKGQKTTEERLTIETASYLSLDIRRPDGGTFVLPAKTKLQAEVTCPALMKNDGDTTIRVVQSDAHTAYDADAEDPSVEVMDYALHDDLSMKTISASYTNDIEHRETSLLFDTDTICDLGIVTASAERGEDQDAEGSESGMNQSASGQDDDDQKIGDISYIVEEDDGESGEEQDGEVSSSADEQTPGTLTFNGADYQVTLTYGADAEIPADASLSVREVRQYTSEYKRLVSRYNETYPDAQKAALFDITILDGEGEELEPAASVQVDIQMSELEEAGAEDVTLVHFDSDIEEIDSEMYGDTLSFEADSFSVYGIFYTVDLKTQVITASGETYEVAVTYDYDAQILDGAELKVGEITDKDKRYADLYDQSVEVSAKSAEDQGVELPIISGTRLFDIEIHGEAGKIEPAAPVQVNIRLTGNKEETGQLSVVHFAEDGVEALENKEVDATDAETFEVTFEADSFSVYTVQSFTSLADKLDGAKYALVSERGTNISSADGKNSVSNFAMTSSTKDGTLAGKGVYKDGNTVGGHVTQWGFEKVNTDPADNQYRIYMTVGEAKQYVKVSGNNLVLDSAGTAFTASVSNNKVRFTYNNQSITSTGSNPSTFVLANNNNNDSLFNLCEVDPGYEENAAKKVSAADWKNDGAGDGKWNENDTVVIYRRIMHDDGSENLYVLATDGTLIRADDGGDSIFYHVPEGKNVNWHISLGADGYHIANVVPEGSSEPTVYLLPSVTDNNWKSDTAVGLTMNGLGVNGDYGTAIEHWDQKTYAYAGLHVDESDTSEIKIGSGVTSDTFLFAVADTLISDGQLHTVDTVDSTSKGITMKIFNYGGPTFNYGYRNGAMQFIMGDEMLDDWNNRKSHVTKTVQPYLGTDGFPISLSNGNTYAPLFTAGSVISYDKHTHVDSGGWGETTTTDFEAGSITVDGSVANNLFLQSYYDENGMFRYSSMENFAHFNTSGENKGKFTVYRETGTPNVIPTQNDHYYYYHGHFMPYNTLDPTVSVSRIVDQYGSITDKNTGRSYENVYGLAESAPDYYVGMTLEANFMQPKDGTLANGDPVVYRFTGDDDLLVFIDGILVLDVGGIHEPLTGSINFETGEVIQPNFYNEGEGWKTHKTTLYDIFKDAHDKKYISDDKWNSMKWKEVNGKPATFADYSTHSFNMFYTERGAGASNLDLAFNLQVIKKDEFTVQKQLPEEIDPRFANQTYKFEATFMDKGVEKPLYPGAVDSENKVVCTKVIYKDRKDAKGQPIEVDVPFNNDENHSFDLRAGEAVIFKMTNEEIQYRVREVNVNQYNLEKVDIEVLMLA